MTREGVPLREYLCRGLGGPPARAKQKPSAAAGSRISGCRCANATPATASTVAMAPPWEGGRGASGWAIARKHHWPAGAPFPPIYRGAGQSCGSSNHGFGRRVFQRFSECAQQRLWLLAWLAGFSRLGGVSKVGTGSVPIQRGTNYPQRHLRGSTFAGGGWGYMPHTAHHVCGLPSTVAFSGSAHGRESVNSSSAFHTARHCPKSAR